MASKLTSSTSRDAVAYVNGMVYTVDRSQPWAEGFIVSAEGLFSDVGSNKDIRAQALDHGLVTYDLTGQFIMPGIHDAHMHIMYAGFSLLNDVHLDMDTTPADLSERLEHGACGCTYAHAFGSWLTASTFNIPDFDRSCLDAKFPDTPVLIMAVAGHSMYANTSLLREAGYDVEHEPDHQAARIVRREDGSLTGELSETAMDKAAVALPKPPLSHVKRALLAAMKEAHKAGVTSLQEPSANSALLSALSELEDEGNLKLDLYAHLAEAPEFISRQPRQEMQDLIENADLFESKHVHTKFVKFILDGVPLPPIFTHCGLDEEGNVDESRIIVTDLTERIIHHDAKGRTVKIHATGHGSVQRSLDAIAAARERNPGGPRHEIAHCNSVQKTDYARFKRLNVTAEMSPAFFFAHPLVAATPDLLDWNFNKFMENEAHITVGSDWVGTYEPAIFPHLARIVETVGGGSKERGGEILCRFLTLAGAQAVDEESRFGSIEVGKKANFIAVSTNLANGEFEEARVVKTWFEGEIVWDAND